MKFSTWLTLIITFLSTQLVFANPEAEQLLRSRMNNPLLKAEGTITGEGVAWHAAYDMGKFMDRYRETQDPAYLESAVQYYDALIAKMHTSPDGYKGWVGPYIYDDNFIGDVHIGDAILINHMLDFSETILKHEDETIVNKYENKAEEYLQLAKKHLIEKWDQRGTWHEDGDYGAYASWDHYMTPDNMDEWRKLDVTKTNLSLPFNKQNSMGIAALRIYRITGEEPYREKALKIFNFMKSRMCLFQDHYVWNYWEPFGPWDIEENGKSLRHWVNVHPYRNYQSGEIHEIVEAYHSGLTFTKDDIQHIINTNLNVMWNGDKETPEWRNSNYAVQMEALGELPIKEAPGGHFPELAGTLWRGLADFSETIRELGKIKTDEPVSFKRKYADLPVTIFERPFKSSKYFTMVAAIPSQFSSDKKTNLVCQTRVKGELQIDLYDQTGEEKIKTLEQKSTSPGVQIITWDSPDVPAGNYTIRWTLDGDYREFQVKVE